MKRMNNGKSTNVVCIDMLVCEIEQVFDSLHITGQLKDPKDVMRELISLGYTVTDYADVWNSVYGGEE